MNKKLEIGMYIRTKNHGIKKILNIGSYCGMTQYILDEEGNYTIGNGIIKSSHNLIDLIEVGDYVNGYKIIRVDEECNIYPKTLKAQFNSQGDMFDTFEEDIKSIVTKEQFKSVEYEVK